MIEKHKSCTTCGSECENKVWGYFSLTHPLEKPEKLIDKWGRDNWFKNLERKDLTEEESKELDSLAFYDQALNTVGKMTVCSKVALEWDEAWEKFYPYNFEKKDEEPPSQPLPPLEDYKDFTDFDSIEDDLLEDDLPF